MKTLKKAVRCGQCQKITRERRRRNSEGLLVCAKCWKKPRVQPPKKINYLRPRMDPTGSADEYEERHGTGQTPDPAKSLTSHLSKAKTAKQAPHLIVEARAGTGKTTTLIEGLKLVKGKGTSLIPSPQQDAIWKAMQDGPEPKTICFVAFNKSIAMELQQRVPEGCDAMTMHSMGYKAVRKAFDRLGSPNNWRVQDIISELLETDIRELRRYRPNLIQATEKLVNLCKMNLTLDCVDNDGVFVDDALADLASYYDIDLNGDQREVFALVPRVLERCKDVAKDGRIDFADMSWLPVVLDLPVYEYDMLLVDECQDLNRCQQQLALRAGKRLILCGDPKQAIYGFAGADSQSMSRMHSLLGGNAGSPDCGKRGCVVLPLTVTRRCGKAIVKEVQKYVPDFEAHETCSKGFIHQATIGTDDKPGYQTLAADGNMILCRCNAPLVSECFKFLRAGRKATIQGRDVGQGLVGTIQKMKTDDVGVLLEKLSDWLVVEQRKEAVKRNPSDARLIALQDRYDCLAAFCKDKLTVDDVIESIEKVFSDNATDGIKLSSVHKAKGLEADRVFILRTSDAPMPHPMAKSTWEREQEYNILYVAITRAKEELVYVS